MKRRRKEASPLKFRRASTLAVSLDADKIVVHNFLSGDKFACSGECLGFLSALDTWKTAEGLFRHFPHTDGEDFKKDITKLLELKAILIKGTPEAALDEVYRHKWQWGVSAGLFHFSVRNTRFITGSSAREFMRKRKAWRKSPSVAKSNRGMGRIIALPTTEIGRASCRGRV